MARKRLQDETVETEGRESAEASVRKASARSGKPASHRKRPAAQQMAAEATAAPAPPVTLRPVISAQQRHTMIAEAADYRAERRAEGESDPERDWYEAEAEINRLLETSTRLS